MRSALSNRNDVAVVNADNHSNDIKQQTTIGSSRQKNSRYSSYSDSVVSSSYLSYVTDDSNNNLSPFTDDDNSIEENLTEWIEKCILHTSLSSALLSKHHDEDMLDQHSILDDDNNNNESVNRMILACDIDSDIVQPSLDLQSIYLASNIREDVDNTTSSRSSSRSSIESATNRINSRKDAYLKIIRNETTIPRPSIETKRSISDDIFNNNYYGY